MTENSPARDRARANVPRFGVTDDVPEPADPCVTNPHFAECAIRKSHDTESRVVPLLAVENPSLVISSVRSSCARIPCAVSEPHENRFAVAVRLSWSRLLNQ